MVTSSAVVGSSAISTSGSQASAIAIITRWRMPPESWCGYSCDPPLGLRNLHHAQHLHGARRAPRRGSPPWCSRTVSAICRPMVSTGLSEVIGSWKIIEIRLPRMRRISRSLSVIRSVPPQPAPRPCGAPGGVGTRRMIDKRGDALAAARLADHAERAAAIDGEGHAVNRTHRPGQRVEPGPQAVDLQQRRSLRGGRGGLDGGACSRIDNAHRHLSAAAEVQQPPRIGLRPAAGGAPSGGGAEGARGRLTIAGPGADRAHRAGRRRAGWWQAPSARAGCRDRG